MKKALVLLLALSMVFSVFAAEPVANVNVSEFKGEAAVTWGVDLDSGKTGFKNDAKVTMKLNLIDGGDKSSTGEGVWGE
ncbi:MAG: autotransporter, partial [Spirochaetaceae bacterium]|nr:autotransporter [Spirochaetaceae bacterium]